MSKTAHSRASDITIYGGGIIGLSCALAFSSRGASVTLVEPVWPPRGASWAAAGMIAPAFEAAATPGTHPQLFDLCMQGAALWPEWSQRLEEETRLAAGYQAEPSLAVALDQEEADYLKAIAARGVSAGFPVTVVDPDDIAVRPEFALELPTDTHVDNRMTLDALVAACMGRQNIHVTPCAPLVQDGPVLVTAGWQSPDILKTSLPVFPLGGQMLSVEPVIGAPNRTVRCGSLYIVPKHDRIIIGATMEPGVARQDIVQADIEALKQRAAILFPSLATAPIIEQWSGVRPGTPDHAPYMGKVRENVFVAAGHHRNGILLAPLTANIMAELILENATEALYESFAPSRAMTKIQS